ncbi:hypothetical protein [Aquimarina agarilytica]|uniref:hypothetical protein n=1 Tax=Aquimarina agarilytica TaxID=1087449 RepID=UPI0002881FC6|nr:hypothetical protein [Aquimarina agarilytica]
MKNIKHSLINPHDFFDDVLSSKRNSSSDPDYKLRIEKLKPNIKRLFNNYDDKFSNRELALINPIGYTGRDKQDLLKLYKYGTKPFQKLKVEITTDENNIINNTCQNCSINEVNTLDHFVPKEEICEFSVHPKNLFPSCSFCNGKKNRFWRDESGTLFLNLYCDTIPDIQYLFVKLTFNSGEIEFEFYLENINRIQEDLFSLIESHYLKLGLLSRFKLSSNEVISDLEHTIISNRHLAPKQDIIDSIKAKHNLNRRKLGFNYWKSILSLALIDCEKYVDSIF